MSTSCIVTFTTFGCTLSQQPPAALPGATRFSKVGQNPPTMLHHTGGDR
ncbi:hypothetical protein [Nostoc sp.]